MSLNISDNTGRWPPCIFCGEIRSLICFKTVSKPSTLIWNISLNVYRSSTMSSFIIFWREPNWYLCFIHVCGLPQRGFSSSASTSLQALIVSLAKACPSLSLVWNRMKQWITLHVWWNMLDDMYKQYKLSSNMPPTFIQHFIQNIG